MAGLRGSLVPVFRPCALAMSERRIASEADERVEMRDEPLGVVHSGNGTPQLLAGDLGRIRAEDACLGFHHLTERSEEHTSELQSPDHLVCRLLLEKKKENLAR